MLWATLGCRVWPAHGKWWFEQLSSAQKHNTQLALLNLVRAAFILRVSSSLTNWWETTTTDNCAIQSMMVGKVFYKATSKKLTQDFMTFSHLGFRKQRTHEKPRSSMQQVTAFKSQKKEYGLSFLTPLTLSILQDHTAGPEKIHTLQQKGRMESLYEIIQLQLKSLTHRLWWDRQRVLSS